MGQNVLTLAEVWPTAIRAVIVGINPSQTSVDAGHYFQGRGARSQVMRLVRTGFLTLDHGERVFERAALASGVGFAGIVRRPTPSARTILPGEMAHGRALLEVKLAARNVPLIIGIYAPPVAELVREGSKLGLQVNRTTWGARVLRLPGPYEDAERAAESTHS